MEGGMEREDFLSTLQDREESAMVELGWKGGTDSA